MDKLTWDLQQIWNRNRDGAYSTQAARLKTLKQAARDLKKMGNNQLRATQVKPKHIEGLVKLWKEQNLATGTIKNRMTHMRWWAEKVGKRNIIPRDNATLGIENRRYVTNADKSSRNIDSKIRQIENSKIRMSLELQKEFGLRREEAIKFQVNYADKKTKIVLKDSWCKGRRSREIPIRTQSQRDLLNRIRKHTGSGSLIPPDKQYIQHLRLYERETIKFGIKSHGLRHAYAQDRYFELTGRKAPAAGGKSNKFLSPKEKSLDQKARIRISTELGHNREEITSVYLGR